MPTQLQNLPLDPLALILLYLGGPDDFLVISEVCKHWNEIFSKTDVSIWKCLAVYYHFPFHATNDKRSLRSKSDYKKQFLASYRKKARWTKEKHDVLLLQAKLLLEKKRDPATALKRLIKQTFPDIRDFNVNWHSALIEENTLLTLATRYCHLRSMIILVQEFGADINSVDMGGFSALVTLAYHGNMAGVKYCLKNGANLYQIGRLRSGAPLTAEHWAAVRGHHEVFRYLRAMRQRLEKGKSAQRSVVHNDSLTQSAEGNSNSEKFCICVRGFEGSMIACDSSNCLIQWYHFECVGLFEEVSTMISLRRLDL